MRTITNISTVIDYSGETPISTPSNEVTTVINDAKPTCCVCCCEVQCCCRKCCCRCSRCCRCRCDCDD